MRLQSNVWRFLYYMVLTSVFFLCWGSDDYKPYHRGVMGRGKGREDPALQAITENWQTVKDTIGLVSFHYMFIICFIHGER